MVYCFIFIYWNTFCAMSIKECHKKVLYFFVKTVKHTHKYQRVIELNLPIQESCTCLVSVIWFRIIYIFTKILNTTCIYVRTHIYKDKKGAENAYAHTISYYECVYMYSKMVNKDDEKKKVPHK